MEKRPCAQGCGKLLDPRGAHKHERTCSAKSPSPKRASRRRKSTAVALRSAPAAVAPVERVAPAAAVRRAQDSGFDGIRGEIERLIAEAQAALRTLDRIEAVGRS